MDKWIYNFRGAKTEAQKMKKSSYAQDVELNLVNDINMCVCKQQCMYIKIIFRLSLAEPGEIPAPHL